MLFSGVHPPGASSPYGELTLPSHKEISAESVLPAPFKRLRLPLLLAIRKLDPKPQEFDRISIWT
jgi:hypothetical protein